MRITITERGGRVRTVETTALDYGDGILIDACLLSVRDLEERGLLLYRDAYTVDSGERACLREEPIAVIEADELDAVSLVEADGLEVLAREGGRLERRLPAGVIDDDGNVLPPPGAGLTVVYASGGYESMTATRLVYDDLFLASEDRVGMRDGRIEWERSAWTLDQAGLVALREEAHAVLEEEDLGAAVCVGLDGALLYPRPSEKEAEGGEDGEGADGPEEGLQVTEEPL